MSGTYIPKALRLRIAEEARHRCGYCLTQEVLVGAPMEIDHLVPEALGGQTEAENLWLACSLCNDHKGDRVAALDPETGQVVRLFNPRAQIWGEHFAWTQNGERLVGLTAVGRATVLALNLNRPSLVRSRKLWVLAGWHPPADAPEPSG
ncbi:HNH endonuclease [Sorangium sp. So ce1389]|uniref:HNH endonuclease n=1 Tax=Sorangium sp. So ce1389 TaxID=3133336 RepID=UPI003F60657A